MAKVRTYKRGIKYIDHHEVLVEESNDPEFQAAFIERRLIQEIGRAVRAMREGAGLSQAELAKLIGTKQSAIARLETSQSGTPLWGTLDRIARALSKQLEMRLGAIDDDKPLVTIIPRIRERRGAGRAPTTDHDAR